MYEIPLLVATTSCLIACLILFNKHKDTSADTLASGKFIYLFLIMTILVSIINAWFYFWLFNQGSNYLIFGIIVVMSPLLCAGMLYAYITSLNRQHALDIKQSTTTFHLPAIIEDILKHPEKRAILEEILKHPEKATLGGTRKHLAIMFTDIRGFTNLSEKLNPDELISFLNDYLNVMSQIVIDNQGTVDKYIGDAIMAFWGPPIESPHHMILAVKTAVDMTELLHKKRIEWQTRGLPDINVGIGINAGEVVVGNIGCDARFDYTCVGDHVNLAERLQEFNKIYGTTIIITEPVYKAVSKLFICRELDIVNISGKNLPILLYEVLGKTIDQKTKAFLHYYAKAFSLFRKQQWPEAQTAFEQALALRKDKVSTLLLERCIKHADHPPKNGESLWESY